jgi:hypothetical protein
VRRWGAALAAVAAAATVVVVLPSAPAGATPPERDGRVLVISVPGLTWEDVNRNDVPNLRRLFDDSAVGDLATRTVSRTTTLADGYVTLGAGTRSVGSGDGVDGEAFAAAVPLGADSAGEIFERRTGDRPAGDVVHLGLPAIVAANESELYDTEVGALGDALAGAGYSRAVIANADGKDTAGPVAGDGGEQDEDGGEPAGDDGASETDGGGEGSDVENFYRRTAVAGLMGSDGTVPTGSVGDELLVADDTAPFGLRLDNAAVVDAFRAVWEARSVVLVEASDLVRQDFYRGFATAEERAKLFRQSLQRTDELVGALLDEVDLRRDIVLVVGPSHPRAVARLTVVALHEPGGEPGLLRSAATRRSGFVQLVDVAPTILDRLGIQRPGSMEGEPVEVGEGGGSAHDRRTFLAEADAAARFRDDHVGPVTTVFVIAQLVLALGLLGFALLRPGWWRLARVLRVGALAGLAYVPAVFLARLFPFHDLGTPAYFAFLLAVAAALGLVYEACGRRHPADAIITGLAVIIAVLVLDVFAGAPLQFNSALGYSPKVAGRFAGFGNLGYAALASATVLLAGLLAHRIGGRRGVWCAVALLVGVFVVDATPVWGSDVGGILSLLPAFAITAILLLGVRVRLGTLLVCAGAAVAALMIFGVLDLALPEGSRSHLGRLFERVGDEGWSSFFTVIHRKADQNLSVLLSSVWLWMVPIVVGLVGWLLWQAPERVRGIYERYPELRASTFGFVVVAAVGFALNDSGIATPGVMLGVFNCVFVALVTEQPSPLPTASSRAGA